jgi:hypothetical protein
VLGPATAAGRKSGDSEAMPGNVRRLELLWVQVEVFKRLGSCGCKRMMELGSGGGNGADGTR